MEKKSNGKLIALIVLGLLTALGLAIEIIAFIRFRSTYSSGSYLSLVVYTLTSLLLLYYAAVGYRKPHGNLMKYLFLMFAVCCLGGVVSITAEQTVIDTIYNYLRGIVVLLVAYVAGRLDRFKQNVRLMSVIGILMLISSAVVCADYTDTLGFLFSFTYFVLWIDLMIAYILRYKEHKEAGLTDK